LIQQFAVKRSIILLCSFLFIHLAAMSVSINFQIPVSWKLLLTCVLFVSLFICLVLEYQKKFCIQFEPATQIWKLQVNDGSWLRFNTVSKIYINQWFVWVVFCTHNKHAKGIIIGRDSLPVERFMQLRRCILSPQVIH